MTGCAGLLVVYGSVCLSVAVLAAEGRVVAPVAVGGQSVPKGFVGEFHIDHVCHRRVRAFVLGVAGPTVQAGIGGLKHTVDRGGIFQLGGYVSMAGAAAVGHADRVPESGVAG